MDGARRRRFSRRCEGVCPRRATGAVPPTPLDAVNCCVPPLPKELDPASCGPSIAGHHVACNRGPWTRLSSFSAARVGRHRRIKSAGSLPSARARIISMPSPTLALPCSMRARYALAMPARAANARCDIPVSARAAITLRARARVSSFGAASASAADGVSGRRFALTPPKNTTASRGHPSVALPGPTGDVVCLPKARLYANRLQGHPIGYLGICYI